MQQSERVSKKHQSSSSGTQSAERHNQSGGGSSSSSSSRVGQAATSAGKTPGRERARTICLLDVFAGRASPLSRQARRRGWTVVTIDTEIGGAAHDLTNEEVLQDLLDRIAAGEFHAIVLAPPCGTFSVFMRLYRHSSRSRLRPMGRAHGRPLTSKERLANLLLLATVRLALAADLAGVMWVWENPVGSLQWRCRAVRSLELHPRPVRHVAVFDWCRFGRRWRKTTRLLGTAPCLRDLSLRCRGVHQHVQLEGSVRCADGVRRSRTSLAACYSPSFCVQLLLGLEADLQDARTLARYGLRGVRIGEASVPGPRKAASSLAAVAPDLRAGVSEVVQERYAQRLLDLERWLQAHSLPGFEAIADMDLKTVNAILCARLQQMALEQQPITYGGELLAAVMKRYTWLRGKLSESWHAQSVWSRAVPRTSRVGMDVEVAHAVAVLSICWGWRVYALLVLVTFHGMLRPGETAALQRGHLRFSALTARTARSLIVVIMKSKTRYRAARVQSVLVEHSATLSWAREVLDELPLQAKLCNGGLPEFRRKLNLLLGALGLSSLPYPQASLRPGGALYLFQQPHQTLLHVMYKGRWSCTKTLTAYLQEGFAALALHAIPPDTARTVSGLAELLDDLVSAGSAPAEQGITR